MSETGVDARRTEGKQVILQAAVRCMVERGYHGTSIRDIAHAAGMTPAAIYHHFASKQDILAVVMTEALEQSYEMTSAAAALAPAPGPRLYAMMRAWVLFHCEQRDYALIGASEIRCLDERHRPAIIALRDRQELAFRDVIQSGVDYGGFRPLDVETTTRAVVTMGNAVSTWFRPQGNDQPTTVADRYADLALNMVGAGHRD